LTERPSTISIERLFRALLAASLALSALLYFVWSWRWPLLGDASLIHYIGFLIERGWAPYRQLGDMNMPGSFLIEMAAMRIFGMGDLAWRFFDFSLLTLASAAFFVVARNSRAPFVTASSSRVGFNNQWLPALFSASLFILIHGRDGLAEGGQRDHTMAVCLLAATAFLFLAVHKRSLWAAATFGLLSGIAATIKPTATLLTLVQLALGLYALRTSKIVILSDARSAQSKDLRLSFATTAGAAYVIAPTLALAFVRREHALAAFLAGFHGIVPFYASLGHRPLSFVVLHSVSPLLPLVLLWFAILALLRPHLDWERATLLAGVLFGLLNCIVQQRALPYYRYPLLIFLLPLMAIDFTRAFASEQPTVPGAPFVTAPSSRVGSTTAAKVLATFALVFGGFFLAPQSAVLIHRYQWENTEFITTLQQNLTTLGGPALSGRIQCIDSISGCGNVLYRMRLEPATGVLSDFLLFGQAGQNPEIVPIVRQTRAEFSAAILAHPPQVIIVTSHLHIDGPDNFEKLARWPAFADFLATHYTLRTEWSPTRTALWWSRKETPASYRIYVLR
jgi:thiamine transporter ThiT